MTALLLNGLDDLCRMLASAEAIVKLGFAQVLCVSADGLLIIEVRDAGFNHRYLHRVAEFRVGSLCFVFLRLQCRERQVVLLC